MPSLSDLLNMGKQYVKDAMPGGLLNPEVNRQSVLDGAALSTTAVPVLGDLLGLGADLNRYATDPESRTAGNFALSGLGMLPFVPAMTAWHGSPHKFDKFSLDKIGTGEGAQAYGHGLYLAESRGVAESYADKLAQNAKLQTADGTVVNFGAPQQRTTSYAAANRGNATIEPWAEHLAAYDGNARKAINAAKKQLAENDATAARMASMGIPDKQADFQRQHWQGIIDSIQSRGKGATYDPGQYMYKTDIPDEAVARFLDWDKPLSQQAPEVQAAINKASSQSADYLEFAKSGDDTARAYKGLSRAMGGDDAASRYLAQQGIPGIRYLDGGSRSAGQGSSNFVAFSPDIIRILERNGIATGEKPWKPGEYSLGGLLGR